MNLLRLFFPALNSTYKRERNGNKSGSYTKKGPGRFALQCKPKPKDADATLASN